MAGSPTEIWRAFAKINLELRILGERLDGFHEVRTVLQTVDLSDEIWVSPSDSFRFSSTEDPRDDSNIVVRAVRQFEAWSERPVGLHLDLRKGVPAGAGLGGGSADAAVTLLGLDRYFGTRIPGEDMNRMLGELGSDVPFFQVGGRVLALGRGEVLFPLEDESRETPSGWFVLACPTSRVSTSEAYSWLTQTSESNTILGFCTHFVPELGSPKPGCDTELNDFEGPLFRRFPELADVKSKLLGAGARFAGLSGSGSALFGEFESEAVARGVATGLFDGPGSAIDVIVTRPVGRREYLERMFDSPGAHGEN
jgi:4-diphosphocytidyl-2-C-methyl-D-erythritol kinase